MPFIPIGALPCLLAVQVVAQAPLTFEHLQAKARPAPESWRSDALLAERQRQSQESRGFLREGPTLSVSAGPRRIPGAPGTTDRGFEVDLPLFLSPRVRAELDRSLGQAHPLLQEAARREGALRLRAAYLDAWLAARLLALREADLATVAQWLKAAQARFEAGADPAYQVALVEGEHLKVQQELDEAHAQVARSWGTLLALTELPPTPVPLADPGAVPPIPTEKLLERLQAGPLRRALLAQADLEERSLRLKEAQELSRWSLRGSYAQEGDEKVTRFGLAVRLPRPGEGSAVRHSTEAQLRALQGEARQALAELDARALGAATRFTQAAPDMNEGGPPGRFALSASPLALPHGVSGQSPVTPSPMKIPDFAQAIAAVGLRLREGRERPSEALPLRRQLLEAQMASLQRLHSQHLLAAELQTLLSEVNP